MNADLMGIEIAAGERAPRSLPAPEPPVVPGSVEGAIEEARRNTAYGSTTEAAGPQSVLEVAQAALRTSRQAAAASLEIIHVASEMSSGAEAAAAVAERLQAEAAALKALGQRLSQLGQCLDEAALALRPSAERRRAALAETLQRFKDQHQAMLHRAEAMLAGGPAISPHQLVSAEGCGLGRWWQAAQTAGWGGLVAFAAVERPHRAVHRALAGLLFAHQQRHAEAAARLRAELEANTAALSASLDALCTYILEPNDPAGGERAGAAWGPADEEAFLALGAGT
jgi:methyl-accepting chemotaxis protein